MPGPLYVTVVFFSKEVLVPNEVFMQGLAPGLLYVSFRCDFRRIDIVFQL